MSDPDLPYVRKYKAKIDLALFIPIVGVMLLATLLTALLPMQIAKFQAALKAAVEAG